MSVYSCTILLIIFITVLQHALLSIVVIRLVACYCCIIAPDIHYSIINVCGLGSSVIYVNNPLLF